jgi:ABC-type lipoprotein export system ATPase subunit
MLQIDELLERDLHFLRTELPELYDFLGSQGIVADDERASLRAHIDGLTDDQCEDLGLEKGRLIEGLGAILNRGRQTRQSKIASITVVGGTDKSDRPEELRVVFVPGTITSIVGPTGSGKSRLLADIEWMAQGDTPTKRTILVNDTEPDVGLRFSLEHKLVAQLSQNMNFVMDAKVGEFIAMHAQSRRITAPSVIDEVIAQANLLAGETFLATTPITSLSGGQSRALMIADTAFLSTSPVVLIDEIENAGIDRKRALDLLIRKEKIVLMATHDPILALMADRRLIIRNGGIAKIIETTATEIEIRGRLEAIDARVMSVRNRLKAGEIIDSY